VSDFDETPDPLLTLFQKEVRAGAATLTEKLAVLLVDPRHAGGVEPLEQAVRQISAAALLVGQDSTADLARLFESTLAEVRQGAALAPDRSGDLLAAVEALVELADAAVDSAKPPPDPARLARLRVRLTSPASGSPTSQSLPTPSPSPPPAPADDPPPGPRPTDSAPEGHAATLLELFREEVLSLSGILSSGLVELEAGSSDPKRIEPLMRAAHSIKGAARIVGCEPAVEVAHAMEEMLVAAQHGQFALDPAAVDALLEGVDLLEGMARTDLGEWSTANAAPAARIATTLGSRLSGPPSLPSAAPPTPEASPAAPAPASETATPVNRSDDKDRVVRVSADSLTRLLSLAGESLVEARWLQPFARSLKKLKRQHDHLTDVLDDLERAVKTGAADDRVGRTAEEAHRRLAESRQVLADRIDEFETHARRSDDLNSRLYREVILSRMRPFADGTHGLGRMVRDVARQLGKKVRFDVAGEDTDVDRDILDRLEAPLGHILRNAVDHGIEQPAERAALGKPEVGTIRIEARHHAGVLHLTVTDDGRGIDPDRLRAKVVEKRLTTADMAARLSEAELYDFLFLPGFSTADTITDVSGRGIGLDAVQATAQAVGGSVRVTSRPGRGTIFELHLPITLSVVRVVLVRVAGDPFALPLNRANRLLRLPAAAVRTLEGKPHFECDGRHVGLVPANLIFDLPAGPTAAADLAVVLVGDHAHQYGLVVEGFLGEQDLVVRPLDARLGKVPNVAAAAVLEDGSPVLIVDVDDVIRSASMLVQEGRLRHRPFAQPAARRRKRVLVVDDSAIVREVERQMLQGAGYEVDVAVDGADGWNAVRAGPFDLVVSDIDMPRMTGLELVRALRSDPRVQSIPVVIVSYKDRDEDRTRGLDAGANYYLTKSSFHDGRFLAAVEELIGRPSD
jgi:two-component system sensor histidine kinase and response regulator WspE